MRLSEKRFLEELIEKIPGLKGYREKDDRRETDKRLREWLAGQLDQARSGMQGAQRDLLSGGKLELLSEADRIGSKLQRAADSLRYASYGYSGFFAQLKIREDELDRYYDYDHDLAENVRNIQAGVAALGGAEDAAAAIKDLEGRADTLITAIEKRKTLFDEPDSEV